MNRAIEYTPRAKKQSLEPVALKAIQQTRPHVVKNGLPEWIRAHFQRDEWTEWNPGFRPDATETIDATHTLRLWEIIDTSRISPEKLQTIVLWGRDVYDEIEWIVELWTTNRYGLDQRMVWAADNEIVEISSTGNRKSLRALRNEENSVDAWLLENFQIGGKHP